MTINSDYVSKVSPRTLIGTVTAAVAFLVIFVPFISHAATLSRQLDIGASGSDVSALQTFLAQDKTLYPQGLVTGYFGSLTASAVSNFQARNGISTVGRVGPATLTALNLQMAGGFNNSGEGGIAPIITSVAVSTNNNSATVSWNTNEFAKGLVYYSPTPLVTVEHFHTVDVSGLTAMTDVNMRTSQSVSIPALMSNTTYYYMIYVTDQEGNVSVTVPSNFRTGN